jgi:Nucleotidyltransferase domain
MTFGSQPTEDATPGAPDPRRDTVARFAAACAADALVIAAFLGGSFAAGTADAFSDLDLYVVTEDGDYDEFFVRREQFVRTWGDPVFLDTSVNFERFGFDMLHFVLADGVAGELALGHRGNLLALHGGPYQPLVDKVGLLAGVSFPLYEPSAAEQRAEVERHLDWFWLAALELAKFLARDRPRLVQRSLTAMRDHCAALAAVTADAGKAGVDVNARLLETYVPAEAAAMRAAAEELVALHRTLGEAVAPSFGLTYPSELAALAEARLHVLPD